MKTKEQIALDIASKINKIENITCPREVLNPRLYFGAMLALNELERLQKEEMLKCVEQAIERHKSALAKLKG